nr:MAG TPA_asm: hypothetical protein [Caudoviricetes sp.]
MTHKGHTAGGYSIVKNQEFAPWTKPHSCGIIGL